LGFAVGLVANKNTYSHFFVHLSVIFRAAPKGVCSKSKQAWTCFLPVAK